MQETQAWSLILEDRTYLGTTKPMHDNYWVCAIEPQLLKPVFPRACGLQQEKPLWWEAYAPQLD